MDEGAVFATARWAAASPRMAATKAFGKLAKTALISTTGLHDTRHTAASAPYLLVAAPMREPRRRSWVTLTQASRYRSTRTCLQMAQRAALSGLGKAVRAHLGGRRERRFRARLFRATATKWPQSRRRQKKNARKNERLLVEARRLELLTLTLPA